MRPEDKDIFKRSRISTVMYTASLIAALIGAALLAVNIYIYISTVKNYISQGYSISIITRSLIPSQLLPGIFQPVVLYGGIALALFGIGKINKNIINLLDFLIRDEHFDDAAEEKSTAENIVDTENTDTASQTDTRDEVIK